MSSSSTVSISSDRYAVERQIIEQEIKRLEGRLTTLETTPTPYPTTVPLSDDLHTALHQSVNEEKSKMERQIVGLRTTYNTYSRFTRLPDELIEEIFVLVSHRATRWSIGRTALKISWICHTLRVLAHRSSALWSFIDFRHPEWVYTALSRTRKHPLDIFVHFSDKHRPVMAIFLSLCLQRLSQIRSLTLNTTIASCFQSTPALDQMWANPAPSLVDLSMNDITLPSDLFAGTVPPLQNLSLMACAFSWQSLRLRNGLKSITISQPESRIPVNQFMDIIRVIAPEVEGISISDALLPAETIPHHSSERYELPNIKALQLHEDSSPSLITTLLNQVTLSSPYLDLIEIVVQGGVEQFDTARALVSARRLNPWPGCFLKVDLEETALDIELKAERSLDRPFVPNAYVPVEPDYIDVVQLSFESEGNHMNFLPMFDIIPLPPAIRTLHIAGQYVEDTTRAQLMSRLGGYGTVQEINVISWFIPLFSLTIQAQVDRLREVGGLDDGVEVDDQLKEQLRAIITFQGLSTLVFDGEEMDEDEPYFVERVELVRLAEWLRWRRLVGLGVEKLVFKTMEMDYHVDFEEIFGDVLDEIEEKGIKWVGSPGEEDDEDEGQEEDQDADVQMDL